MDGWMGYRPKTSEIIIIMCFYHYSPSELLGIFNNSCNIFLKMCDSLSIDQQHRPFLVSKLSIICIGIIYCTFCCRSKSFHQPRPSSLLGLSHYIELVIFINVCIYVLFTDVLDCKCICKWRREVKWTSLHKWMITAMDSSLSAKTFSHGCLHTSNKNGINNWTSQRRHSDLERGSRLQTSLAAGFVCKQVTKAWTSFMCKIIAGFKR